jgi:thymidylate synthase
MFSLIIEIDNNNGISKNGTIPWNYPECSLFFNKLINNNVIIMGRRTWDILPIKPIPNCINVVITNGCVLINEHLADVILNSIEECLNYFSTNYINKYKLVIGGKSIYEYFLTANIIYEIYVTHIKKNYNCDTFLNLNIDVNAGNFIISNNNELSFNKYFTINNEENQMLTTLQNLLLQGDKKIENITTNYELSIFCKEFKFNISNWNIPIMTINSVDLKIIFDELILILRNQNNISNCNDKYGEQCQKSNSSYCNEYNQLNNIIKLLNNNPLNHDIFINLYQKSQLLNPRLYSYQFYVYKNTLSCKLINMSTNIVTYGFNDIASGVLFIFMLCAVTNLLPGEFIWSPCDIYIHSDQIDSIKQQLTRKAKPFPILQIIKNPKNNNILNFEYDCFKLLNYNPHYFIY